MPTHHIPPSLWLLPFVIAGGGMLVAILLVRVCGDTVACLGYAIFGYAAVAVGGGILAALAAYTATGAWRWTIAAGIIGSMATYLILLLVLRLV